MTYDQGIYDGIPAADYHADKLRDEPTLSRSGIHTILNGSMADYAASSPRLRNPEWPDPEPDETDANILGSVVHATVLGGNGGAKYIVGDPSEHVIPSSKTGERYTTWSGAARDWKKAREVEGYKVINHATNAKAVQIAAILTAALEERFGREAWAGRKVEHTLIFSRRLNDGSVIWMRARPDAILPDGTIVDIKTTALGLSDAELGKRIALDGLDIQNEVYREGALAVELDRAANIDTPPERPPVRVCVDQNAGTLNRQVRRFGAVRLAAQRYTDGDRRSGAPIRDLPEIRYLAGRTARSGAALSAMVHRAARTDASRSWHSG